ncbi:MAG: diphthine--ammonia ligase [Opitutaceae bacterium]|nr:diphthine--ammonia ligase [Opitutaceae bacterium]
MGKEKIVLCWSGGKDSALALHRLQQKERYEVLSLVTTCNEHFQRVSMHGIRIELLERQAEALGLPLETIFVSERSSNEEYGQRMSAALKVLRTRGATACAFGDIFLEDLRTWREAHLAQVGMRGVFPLWRADTRELLREFFTLGFGATICCVNDAYLVETAVGRELDPEFVRSLPTDVDPCGENGEFHSFAHSGPIFRHPVRLTVGKKVYRPLERPVARGGDCPLPGKKETKGFWFCDLLPG